jgi:tetratricopeptide (TPR) repeat protein
MKLGAPFKLRRRTRSLEVAVLLTLVACTMLALRPVFRRQDQEAAQRRARAQAMIDSASQAGRRIGQVAPVVAGLLFNASPARTPKEVAARVAPLTILEMTDRLEKAPNDPRLLYSRARAYFATGDYAAQIADLERVLELRPEWAYQAENDLAWTLSLIGRYEAALPHIRTALKEVPSEANCLDTLGYTYVGLGRDREAVEAYTEALSERQLVSSLWGRAAALRHLGRQQEALADLARARQLDPDFSLSWGAAVPSRPAPSALR